MFLLKKIIEIALSSKDDETIQATEWIETYAREMKKRSSMWEHRKKCSNIIKQYKNVLFDYIKNEDIKENNRNRPEIPDQPYIILVVRGTYVLIST